MFRFFVVIAVLAMGCRSKEKLVKQEPAGSAAPDSAWLDMLPEVADGGTQLTLDTAGGLVAIKADGSLHVGTPPTSPASDPRKPGGDPFAGARAITLGELTTTLGLPAIAPRDQAAISDLQGTDGAGDAALDPLARLGHPAPASGSPPVPERATKAFGVVHEHDVSAGVIVFADARAPAAALVDVLAQTGGFIAVRRGDQLGALRLAMDRHGPAPLAPHLSWIEVRIGNTIELESVPSKPVAIGALDDLDDALVGARTTAIDILVTPTTIVKDLVNAIETARAANVEAIGLGIAPAPGTAQAHARGEHGPRVIAWSFAADAQGEAAGVRGAFDTSLDDMRTCYTAALAKSPELAGTANVKLYVQQRVARADVDGVPSALVTCVTSALAKAKFNAKDATATLRITFVPAPAAS